MYDNLKIIQKKNEIVEFCLMALVPARSGESPAPKPGSINYWELNPILEFISNHFDKGKLFTMQIQPWY